MPDSDNTAAGWSSQDKLNALLETTTLSEAEVTKYCLAKGVHTSQIAVWRAACIQANEWGRASNEHHESANKASGKQVKQLKKDLTRKKYALAEEAALLILRRKLHAVFVEDVDV